MSELSHLSKRLVFTDGLKNPHSFQDYADGVYAIIGPFADFTADESFQDELLELCRKYNLEHGHLSKKKYRALREPGKGEV